MSGATAADARPDELYKVAHSEKVAHIREDCSQILKESSGRWVDATYLARGGYRQCSSCGDGEPLDGSPDG